MDPPRRQADVGAWTRLRRRMKERPPKLPAGVAVGRHTYGHDELTFPIYTEGAQVVVGAFCSIGPGARVHGGGAHVLTRASTFPLHALMFDPDRHNAPDDVDTGPTVIGNDVWIGAGAIVLGGVRVADGAVIGAGAVVVTDVPAYAIVAGNPGRVLRHRFDERVRERLLALRWWEWSDERIRAMESAFMGDVESFLAEAEASAS